MMNKYVSLEERKYDASLISDFLSCPRLFYYRYVKKYTPTIEPPPLLFGRVFHQALLIWYNTGDVEKALPVFEEIPRDIGDDRRTKEHASVILKEYVKRYKDEPYTIKQQEIEFNVDMGEGRSCVGRIDQIIEWSKQNYVKDHKTTSQLGLTFFRSFRPSVQIDCYIYACRELCGQCSGAVINGISIAAKPKERFMRDVSSRTPGEIDRFREMFHLWCGGIEVALLRKEFPMNYTNCNRYGECVFKELCIYGEDEKAVERICGTNKEGGEK